MLIDDLVHLVTPSRSIRSRPRLAAIAITVVIHHPPVFVHVVINYYHYGDYLLLISRRIRVARESFSLCPVCDHNSYYFSPPPLAGVQSTTNLYILLQSRP